MLRVAQGARVEERPRAGHVPTTRENVENERRRFALSRPPARSVGARRTLGAGDGVASPATLGWQTPGQRSPRLPCTGCCVATGGQAVDSRTPQDAKVLLERCESGRIGVTANELTWVTGSEGSNPSLSARESGTVVPDDPDGWPAPAGLPGSVAPAGPGLVRGVCDVVGLYWLQTLGCPKNQVDSDKLEGYLAAQGYGRAPDADAADLVVVNTCAFIDAARQESIDTVLTLADRRRPGARLVVTGCMAERYGDELRDALPEVDLVAGFGAELTAATPRAARPSRSPSRRAPRRRRPAPSTQRVRPPGAAPARRPRPLGLRQGRRGLRPHLRLLRHPVVPGQAAVPVDRGGAGRGRRAARHRRRRAGPARDRPRRPGPRLLRPGPLGTGPAHPHRQRPVAHCRADPRRVGPGRAHPAALPLSLRADRRADRDRLATGVPYFDLSLQHVSRPLLAGMRRWGDGDRFLRRIADIRAADARRHLPLLLHPRLPRRDRARPRSAARVPRGGAARLGRLLPVLPRGRHPRRRPRRAGAGRARARAPARVRRAAGRHHGGQAGRAHRRHPAGPRRRARPGPHRARGARDRRHRPPARRPGGRQPRRRRHHRRGGARPVRRAGRRPESGPRRRGSGAP